MVYISVVTGSGQSSIEEVAELCHTSRLTVFTPKILVTVFSRHLLHGLFSSLSPAYLHPSSSPLSHTAPEPTSTYIHVPEHHSRKIRVGGVPLQCAAPYVEH